jgi:TrmH family RNA methyltransferase
MDAKDFRRQDFSRKTELRLRGGLAGHSARVDGGKIAAMPPVSQRTHSRIVQSRQNSRVKELRAAFATGNRFGNMRGAGRIGIEGEHLLAEAGRSGIAVATVFFRSGDEALLERITLSPGVEIIELTADVFASAVTTGSPQGIAALVEPPIFPPADLLRGAAPLIVVAVGLQDPGNLGTLVRSAEAFGATGMALLPGTVSLWNSKALRASSGSAFRLPVVAAGEEELFSLLRSSGVAVFAAVAERGRAAAETDLCAATAILIGNEGSGLPQSIIDQADGCITIPCPGPVESLNAGVAASILLYEAARQRANAGISPPRTTPPASKPQTF